MDALSRQAARREALFTMMETRWPNGQGTRLCLWFGMDPQGTNSSGTPLAFLEIKHPSQIHSQWASTKLLLQASGLVDQPDWAGDTPLGLAAAAGPAASPLVRWLLEHGANPLHENSSGRNCLFRSFDAPRQSSTQGNLSTLEALLEAAGPTAQQQRNRHGQDLQTLAQGRGDEQAYTTLLAWEHYWKAKETREALGTIARSQPTAEHKVFKTAL
jgi:hypothetical protein